MGPKNNFMQWRLDQAKKQLKRGYSTRPDRWGSRLKDTLGDQEVLSSSSSDAGNIRRPEDDSLLGDISEMSEEERGVLSGFLQIHRRLRSKYAIRFLLHINSYTIRH